MTIQDIFHITNLGYALVTDKAFSQRDWEIDRRATRISVIIDEERVEFDLLSVELTLKRGIDYVSYLVSEDLEEILKIKLPGCLIET